MGLLLAGVVLWSVMHFLPAGAAGLRGNMVGVIGEGPWKGLVALSLILSIALIVMGWRSTIPAPVYAPPGIGTVLMTPLMILAVVLLGAANAKTNIKRYIRHPMLTGIIVWAAAHLMTNGDDRTAVLFGGFGLWAIVMIIFINKRDGAWQKPESVPPAGDIKLFAIAAIIFIILVIAHPYFAGVTPLVLDRGL